jgi:hypothetical protein
MLDVVRDVCGVHAQVQSCAELQLWTRVRGAAPGRRARCAMATTKPGANLGHVQPFARFSAAQRKAIASEADGLGAFLGAPTTVSYN